MNTFKTDEIKARLEAQYDLYAEKFSEFYQAGQDKSQEAMEKALEAAREQLAAAGELSAEQGAQFKAYLKRDLAQTAEDMRQLGEEAKLRLDPGRLGAGAMATLAGLLQAAGKGFEFLSQKTEQTLVYKTGEVTGAGTLTCLKCGKQLQMKKSSHIPPCPACSSTQFRKSY